MNRAAPKQVDINHSHLVAWRLGRSTFGYTGDPPLARGLLIGECPGPNTNAKLPLFPDPNGSAAGRLLRYSDIDTVDWMGKLVRINMCDGRWSDRNASAGRMRALTWLLDPANWYDGKPLRVLLLGQRVAAKWFCDGPFGQAVGTYPGDIEIQYGWIPHPSGRNLLYNERKNQLRARRAVLWAIGERDKP